VLHLVNCGIVDEANKKRIKSKMPRASATLTPEVYETLEHIAREKKVSLSWVIRDAAESYIADKWPLFKQSNMSGDTRK
jgi:metal-responsive CopG/Arc/MetJ family transcriptional regulator